MLAFRLVMEQAVAKGWRTDKPAAEIRMKKSKRAKIGVWEPADVDAHVAADEDLGLVSIARIIFMEWENGQSLTDARPFHTGAEYDATDGAFRFRQAKIEAYVTLRVSLKLRGLLAESSGEIA